MTAADGTAPKTPPDRLCWNISKYLQPSKDIRVFVEHYQLQM